EIIPIIYDTGGLTISTEGRALGRGGIFSDYRLRVASVLRDYGMHRRAETPPDLRAAPGG
ncbi:MAG: hypothetical protein KKB63_16375, partial [Alphaproteobacteria bacterium]|nr:hypothetical protein [Alphaproteobacteria bacterium]